MGGAASPVGRLNGSRNAGEVGGGIVGTKSFTVLVVEDHPVTRLGLKSVIDAQADLRVIADTPSADQAIELASRLRPDLIVLPLRIEGALKGVELCRELVSLSHSPKVLIYSSYNAPEHAFSSFLSGAHGFVHKGEETGQLIKAIRAALGGRRTWLLGAEHSSRAAQLEGRVRASGLTKRELEVLGLVLQRFSNGQIANELFIELPTVKTHMRSILGKLGIRSRRELF